MVRKPSLLIAVLIALLLVALRTSDPPRRVITWDVFGYYLYLPALFIHDDLGLRDRTWLDEIMVRHEPSSTLYQLVDQPDRTRLIKYTSGMAAVYAPFFFAAHLLAEPLGHPADGFSPPYQYLVAYGCLLYIIAGLFLLRSMLRRYFSERWTAVLLVLVVLGTNYLHLAVWDGNLFTHPILFTLYAGLILATIIWHERPTWLAALAIGISAGMITWIRPPEAIVIAIPLLWGLHGPADRAQKWSVWRTHPGHLILIGVSFVVMLIPQAMYWRFITGDWITNSYANNPGEGFDILRPHVINYLFSFRKGWFVYTPLMILAIVGIPLLWRKHRALFWPMAVFLVLHLWIVASWSTWWYAGGSFSARSMVPVYALLAIPLGAALQCGWARRSLRIPIVSLLAGLLLLNLFQTWQWHTGIIEKERMTKAYYLAIFGRTERPPHADRLLLVGRSLVGNDVLTDTTGYARRVLFQVDHTAQEAEGFPLSDTQPFAPGPDMTYHAITRQDHAWLRTTATLWVDSAYTGPPPLVVMTFHHRGRTYAYRTSTWTIPAGAHGWQTITMDYLTPEVRDPHDNLKVYIWAQDGGDHRIGSIRVEAYERASDQ